MTTRNASILAAAALAITGGVVLMTGDAPTQNITLAWEVAPGAAVTGVEQSDTLPPQWREVASFPVPTMGGSFTSTVTVVNGQGYWRAFTR